MPVTTAKPPGATGVLPFTIKKTPEAELEALRARIVATRWPEKETVADQSQGVQLKTIQALARYWAKEYDWRKCEAKLSALPHFITKIDGLDIHFIHVRSKHDDALPLIVTHGWPGSVVEQLKIIECFPPGDPVDPGLWVFRQADHHRLGPRPHRAGLGRADEAPRVHEIRGARRRLGRGHHRTNGSACASGVARHSHQHARHLSSRH
jgi:hypothetical protein